MQRLRWIEWAGVLALGAWGAVVAARIASRRIPWLDDYSPAPDLGCPPVRVVVPACNEALTIEPAMESLLSLDYPQLEIVAVDDRSTDDTGRLLDSLSERRPLLRVLHLTNLPPGWLGKNHALQQGSSLLPLPDSHTAHDLHTARDSESWILFTDADVLFRPDALRRAIAAGLARNADHVVVAPGLILTGFWERLLCCYFALAFSLATRAWDVESPRLKSHIGIGAFNLIRRSAYDRLGQHTRLRMEVADDLRLGKLVKLSGGRQTYLLGGDPVKVQWISGLGGFIRGLEKNAFSGLDYRWDRLLKVTLFLGTTHVLPAIGLVFGTRLSRGCFVGAIVLMMTCATPPPRKASPPAPDRSLSPRARALHEEWKRTLSAPWTLYGAAFPLAAAVFLFTLWRSAILAEWRGGITWRGTTYHLEELRRNVV